MKSLMAKYLLGFLFLSGGGITVTSPAPTFTIGGSGKVEGGGVEAGGNAGASFPIGPSVTITGKGMVHTVLRKYVICPDGKGRLTWKRTFMTPKTQVHRKDGKGNVILKTTWVTVK